MPYSAQSGDQLGINHTFCKAALGIDILSRRYTTGTEHYTLVRIQVPRPRTHKVSRANSSVVRVSPNQIMPRVTLGTGLPSCLKCLFIATAARYVSGLKFKHEQLCLAHCESWPTTTSARHRPVHCHHVPRTHRMLQYLSQP